MKVKAEDPRVVRAPPIVDSRFSQKTAELQLQLPHPPPHPPSLLHLPPNTFHLTIRTGGSFDSFL